MNMEQPDYRRAVVGAVLMFGTLLAGLLLLLGGGYYWYVSTNHLAPGDAITVIVDGRPELTSRTTINDRDEARFRELGVVRVGGMSKSKASDLLSDLYSAFLGRRVEATLTKDPER